jgi:recombination protein RecT
MTNKTKQLAPTQTLKQLILSDSHKKRFEELLKEKAPGFITSLLQIANGPLSEVDPSTILNAAATAAALDLPINKNLGYAWIVPYKGKAQFQMGYKGYIQLALRTGEYLQINAIEVFENQFEGWNSLTENLIGDFSLPPKGKRLGFACFFRLKTGFYKTLYWTDDQMKAHGKKYSKSYGYDSSLWKDPIEAPKMGLKTIIKAALSKWGILSIELQTALAADQSIQYKAGQYSYDDNPNKGGLNIQQIDEEKERERILKHIEGAEDIHQLAQVVGLVSEYNLGAEYQAKAEELEAAK